MKPPLFARIAAAAALLLAGCGRTDKAPANTEAAATHATAPAAATAAPAARDGDREHPIPLERALAEGICAIVDAKTIPFDSRHVSFVLAPKVPTQPWLRVESGWKLTAQKGPGAMLTVLPASGQLYAQNNSSISVSAVELAHAHTVPLSHNLARLPAADPLAPLLQAVARFHPPPSWAVIDTAVCVLTQDINLTKMRARTFSASRTKGPVIILGDASGSVLAHAGVIDNAGALLMSAGHDPGRFTLFREADAKFAKALADWRAGARGDLQALDELGFFRARPEAFAALTSVWHSRPTEKKYYRETAVRRLGEGLVDYSKRPYRVDHTFRAALQAALAQETDPALRQKITAELARADQAAKP